MATMKDVAKLAGVSVTTVSNIINKTKSANSDTVRRVDEAMKQLGFSPNASARSLRGRKSKIIGVILPDLTNSIYSNLLQGIEEICSTTDYRIEFFSTADLPTLEVRAVKELLSLNCELIVIVSCCIDSASHIDLAMKNGVSFIFVRRKPVLPNCTFIGIDEYSCMYNRILSLYQLKSPKSISLLALNKSYSNEIACARAFQDACDKLNIDIKNITHIDMGKERAFQVVSQWIVTNQVPDLIICTSPLLAEGAQAAIDFFLPDSSCQCICLHSFNWTHLLSSDSSSILSENYYSLGSLTGKLALETLTGTNSCHGQSIILPAREIVPSTRLKQKTNTLGEQLLRLLLKRTPSSEALSTLIYKFTKQTNLAVEIQYVEDLTEDSPVIEAFDHFDIIEVPQEFLPHLVNHDLIVPLTDSIIGKNIRTNYTPTIIDVYSKVHGEIYGIPHIPDCLLLLYRHDLFEDAHLKQLYFELYKKSLCPPVTLSDYIQIAGFFTKAKNIHSPVSFGTSLNLDMEQIIRLYLPLLWELTNEPAGLYDKINYSVHKKVLQQLRELYEYSYHTTTSEDSLSNDSAILSNGDVAMSIVSRSDFQNHQKNYPSNDSIKKNIHASKMPGLRTVQGGSSLVISKQCQNETNAITFLNWFFQGDISIAYNILGGCQPTKDALDLIGHSLINPWLTLCCESLEHSAPLTVNTNYHKQNTIQTKLGHLVNEFLSGSLDLDYTATEIHTLFETIK